MKIRALILASLGLIWMAAPAHAVSYDLDAKACPDDSRFISTGDVTGDTGGSDACFGAFDGNDPGPSADGVETGGMVFDFIAKSDMVTGGDPSLSGADIGLTVTFGDDCKVTQGADDNGCWSFTALPTGYEDFMIVIKAANSPGWAAYLFDTNSDQRSGTWQVAWGSVMGNGSACKESAIPNPDVNCKDISHLAIYAKRGGDMQMAEPGTLGLLGLGLVGLGVARRRRQKA